MKPRLQSLIRTLALAGAVAALAATTARAQTAEGTVITNTATVSFTDANSNTYSSVSDNVSITVGFQAGIDVIAASASVTPASPSTADTIAFDVANIGNGADTVTVSESISVGGIMTVTGYRYSGTTYGSLAALNSALAEMAQDDTITVQVIYDVASGQGGQSTVYTMTATSRRDGGTSDNDVTTITPSETIAVAVTPDGSQNVQQLPSNGTNYTFTFTVQNNGNGPEDFDLLASSPGSAVITIVSVNAVAGDSTQINLAASASTTIDVVYSVASVAAGSTDTLNLRARSVTTPATLNDGYADLTVIRPSVTVTKEAFTDAGLTTAVSGTVLPGQSIWYKVTVSNSSGTAAATTIDVDDDLPSEVSYVTHGDDSSGWTITKLNGPPEHIDATLPSLAAGSSVYFWIEVTIN